MDDDDDSSFSSDMSPSPPPPPISVVHASDPPLLATAQPSRSVTVASASPLQTLTLALPIQPPPGSAGREDFWSEGATSALIDAWGDHFLELSRGNLKQKHWQSVADVVSSREDYTKPPRTDVQCKNRIDTLKKKYKSEKAKISTAGGDLSGSSWPFFNRLDFLLGPIMKSTPASVASSARSQFPQKQRTNLPMKRKAPSLPSRHAYDSSTSDSLPPAPSSDPTIGRRRRVGMEKMRELTQAILKFGEMYQRVESSKLQQAMEMEKQRMGFARDLETQRVQFFMKTQMELSQLGRHQPSSVNEGGGTVSCNNYLHHGRRRHHPGNGSDNGIGG